MITAVFLDRDGVVNVNIPRGYVTEPDEFVVLPGVAASIKRLNDLSIPVIIISNQQGVGKGLMSRAALTSVDDDMHAKLKTECGAIIQRSYYCVHLSTDCCDCRKPRGGQLLTAASDFSINLATSIFVGDASTDIQAGKAAGVGHCALVLSGATKSFVAGTWPKEPDSIHLNLASAVDWVLSNQSPN